MTDNPAPLVSHDIPYGTYIRATTRARADDDDEVIG